MSQYKINSALLHNKGKKIEQSKTVSFLIYAHAGNLPEIHIILEISQAGHIIVKYEVNTDLSRFSLLVKDKKSTQYRQPFQGEKSQSKPVDWFLHHLMSFSSIIW